VSMSYKLPAFPADITQALEMCDAGKFRIGSKQRSIVIDAIHGDLVKQGIL